MWTILFYAIVILGAIGVFAFVAWFFDRYIF